MQRPAPALILAGLLFAGCVLLLSRAPSPPGPRPPAPARGPDGGAGPAPAPAVFSPEAAPAILPAATGTAPAPKKGAGKKADPYARLTRAALAQLGPRLRELGDVTAYLDGKPDAPLKLVDLPAEVRAQLLALLTGGTPEARLKAALALSVAELDTGQIRRLEGRFDAAIDGVAGEAGKNLVLALAFALYTHDDLHGVRALSDALRTGRDTGVKGFRNGATFLLALVDDEESAPLMRELLAEDPDRLVRKHAAVGLGRLGGEENRAALREALARESDVEVRAWSALAMGRAKEADGAADPDSELLRALHSDPAGEVRGAAAFALSRTGGSGTAATLEQAFYADDHPLARIGAVAGVALRAGDGAEPGFLSGQGAPYLASVIRESGDQVARFYAVAALGMLPASPDRAAALRRAVADDSAWVRGSAITTLAGVEGADALPFLRRRLADEPSEGLRRQIQSEIDRLKKP